MSKFGHSDVKIRDFIVAIKSGKYRLPCFQRDFRWSPAKIKSLLNSIQHEYPAGSLLFLKVNKDNPLIPSKGFNHTDENAFTEKAEMLVLDGQQRLTSCFCAFTNRGYYTYYIDFVKLMKLHANGVTDFDFETLIVHKRHNSSPFTELAKGLFPISFLIDRKTMRNQIEIFVSGIQGEPGKEDICKFLNYTFGDIVDSILDYEFPVVELPESSSMEAVCKVFQTINTTGLKLSVFDICVAVFMPKNINLKDLVNESIQKKRYVKALIERDATIVLQVVALLANKVPNANTLAKELEADDITDYWNDAIDGIEQALMLFDSFGAGTKKNLMLLPYTPMVTIVAAVLSRIKYTNMDVPTRAKAEQKIKTYFYTVALSTRYTEGTNAKINEDFKGLKQWISNGDIPTMISHGVDWNTEKIVENNKNGAFGKAILCMLNSNGLKDFYGNASVGVGENLDSCDLHHIFPKAQYEELYPQLINSVFNFTWILKDSNIHIQDAKTIEYLDKIIMDVGISESRLKNILNDHYIDDTLYQSMRLEKYIEFIYGRAELFKQLFDNAGVKFMEVAQDELEVELADEEDN